MLCSSRTIRPKSQFIFKKTPQTGYTVLFPEATTVSANTIEHTKYLVRDVYLGSGWGGYCSQSSPAVSTIVPCAKTRRCIVAKHCAPASSSAQHLNLATRCHCLQITRVLDLWLTPVQSDVGTPTVLKIQSDCLLALEVVIVVVGISLRS